MRSPDLAKLSAREEQVLGLAAEGLLDKQIALSLNVSENTLRTYWRRIRSKLGETSRAALAALYTKGRHGEEFEDMGVWTYDVVRGQVDHHGDRSSLPQGVTSLDEALTAYHPDDRERVRQLIVAMTGHDLPPVTITTRTVTPQGYEAMMTRIEPLLNAKGETEWLVGRPVPLLNFAYQHEAKAHTGFYRRDLLTNEVTVDEGLREIYRIPDGERDSRAAVLRAYCPSSKVKMDALVESMVAQGQWRLRWTACLCFGDERLLIAGQSQLVEQDGKPIAFTANVIAFY